MIELVINLVTLAPSVVVVRRTRVRRHALGGLSQFRLDLETGPPWRRVDRPG